MNTTHQIPNIGKNIYHIDTKKVIGEFVQYQNEDFYVIRNYDHMPPFFMSIVSSSDLWLFISSTGGLSAGRINAEFALFPYYTDDKLSENHENTGPFTIIKALRQRQLYLWEPFSNRYKGIYRIERNLYKNVYGNKLIFEEVNHDLELTYSYGWYTCDKYGFIKISRVENTSPESCQVILLDGLQNILPYGITSVAQNTFSNLLNAYKRNEIDRNSGVGIFSLSSTLTDLAEPSESLKATTVWQHGLAQPTILLSTSQVENFRQGQVIIPETDVRGQRGAYLVISKSNIDSLSALHWTIGADVNQDSVNVIRLINALKHDPGQVIKEVNEDIENCTNDLIRIVASADGLQKTNDRLSTSHHYANVLNNTMRGGIFINHYLVNTADLTNFIRLRNKDIFNAQAGFLENLPAQIHYQKLIDDAMATGSNGLTRLCLENLPITFSRRHGDPSRPWNRFSINIKNPDGTQRVFYQGNWRDIFQNWEPLAWSFPEFVEGMIAKFANATTADGYNPYRITRDGIEWEVPSLEHPWANIGYWGDHQIIYLLKLLEISIAFHPGFLQTLLVKQIFSHANIPYRIKEYSALTENPYNSIEYDWELDRTIKSLEKTIGQDGTLVMDKDGKVFHVNLVEKLLILLLTKVGNFVPEGGIWMNTQRPEWNDANNALTGRGLSVVTMSYLRRFVVFFKKMLATAEWSEISLTNEVKNLFTQINEILIKYEPCLKKSFSNQDRREMMDALGQASSSYRWNFYRTGFSGDFEQLDKNTLYDFLTLLQTYFEQSLQKNRRPDALYHSYNILYLSPRQAWFTHLYEMLEGQVAILSSGMLYSMEALTLLKALRNSKMYRADQHSYMLYPDRNLPGFLEKNCIPAELADKSILVKKLIEQNDRTLIVKDENGIYHFNGNFRNAKDVQIALNSLKNNPEIKEIAEKEEGYVLDLFEKTFNHSAFTGRSGTFFAYEGLGSIYWHMVSKLLVAIQETFFDALESNASSQILNELFEAYHDVRLGIGFNKTPEQYGAFPMDPYSHTPSGQGAKQPGMTGQVKEEILTRLGEMGVVVRDGILSFKPDLLPGREFIPHNSDFQYFDLSGRRRSIELPANSLAYTFCQVPIIYHQDSVEKIVVKDNDGHSFEIPGNTLNKELSEHIFKRDGKIAQINFSMKINH